MRTRRLRLPPEVAKALELRLEPIKGQRLKYAQAAILEVYHSGLQMANDELLEAYNRAITAAIGGQ